MAELIMLHLAREESYRDDAVLPGFKVPATPQSVLESRLGRRAATPGVAQPSS